MTAESMKQIPSTSTSSISKPRSFATLDALRGVAALPVVYVHTARMFGHHDLFAHGSLAVDFFFLLSGFVMSYVYQEKLDAGWSSIDFLRVRVIRLYPLYIAGSLLGAAFMFFRSDLGKVRTPVSLMIEFVLLAVLFLPRSPTAVFPTGSDPTYPLNVPAWSLAYELIANGFHSVAMRRRSILQIGLFVALQAALLLWLALRFGTLTLGPDRSHYLFGFCRVLFSYPLGALLYVLWTRGRFRIHLHPLLVAVLLIGLLAMPTWPRVDAMYQWVTITMFFPALLWMGASVQPSERFARLASMFGALSYPLYILHVPFFHFFEQAWFHISHHRIETSAPWSGVSFLIIVVPLSYWMGQTYDPKVRSLLQKRLLPSKKLGSR